MKSIANLIQEKRKTLRVLGEDDRTNYYYHGDPFNRFVGVGEHRFDLQVFLQELLPKYKVDKFSKLDLSKSEIDLLNNVLTSLKLLFPEDKTFNSSACVELIKLNFMNAVATKNLILQDRKIEANVKVCEFGPGSGLLSMVLISDKRVSSVTIVEGIIPLLFLQQALLAATFKDMGVEVKIGSTDFENKTKLRILPAWELDSIIPDFDVYVAENFWDQITPSDFVKYSDWMMRGAKGGGDIFVIGGFERSNLPPQYFFGFGDYPNDVYGLFFKTHGLSIKWDEKLFLTNKHLPEIRNLANIQEFETEFLNDFPVNDKVGFFVDSGALFVSQFQEIFERRNLDHVYSFSASTQPSGGMFRNIYINDSKQLNELDSIVVCSYRSKGLIEDNLLCEFSESRHISDRLTVISRPL